MKVLQSHGSRNYSTFLMCVVLVLVVALPTNEAKQQSTSTTSTSPSSSAPVSWLWNTLLKNKKTSRNGKHRRRLTEMPQMTPDLDAATGTVTKDAPEVEAQKQEELQQQQAERRRLMEEQQKNMSCDAQLAQALVQAKELQEETQTALVQAQGRVEALQGELEERTQDLSSMQDEKKKLLDELLSERKEKEEALQTLTKAKDQRIAQLQELLDAKQGEAEQIVNEQLNAVQQQVEKQQKESEELIEATKKEAKRVLKEKVASLKDEQKQLETKHLEQLATIKQQLKDIKTEKENASKMTRDMQQKYQLIEKELKVWQAIFDNRTYCNMTYIAEDIQDVATSVWEQSKEIAQRVAKSIEVQTKLLWIRVKAVSHQVWVRTRDTSVVLAKEANVHGRKLAKDVSVHAKTGYAKASDIYVEQSRQIWPQIEPHYEKHVLPLVKQGKEWKGKNIDPTVEMATRTFHETVDPHVENLNEKRKVMFVRMVDQYATTCKDSYQAARKFAKEHDMVEEFQNVGPSMKASCQNPEQSVISALKVIAFLCLLPFIPRLFRLVGAGIRLVWNIFLTVTLLRFILPKRNNSAGSNDDSTLINKKQKKQQNSKSRGREKQHAQ